MHTSDNIYDYDFVFFCHCLFPLLCIDNYCTPNHKDNFLVRENLLRNKPISGSG